MSSSKTKSSKHPSKAASKAHTTKKPASPQASGNSGSGSRLAPSDQLARICAQRASISRGAEQHEWFELGRYVSVFGEERRRQQQQQNMPVPAEPITATAAAG